MHTQRKFSCISLAFGLSLALLTGCAGTPPPVSGTQPPAVVVPLPPPSTIPIVAKSVSAAGQSLTLAMRTATVYTNLPRCDSAGATVVCSEREIVREIRAAAIKAHNAYIAARKNEALLGAALSAIDIFTNLIPRS